MNSLFSPGHNYRKWCQRQLELTGWFILMIVVLELITIAIKWLMGIPQDATGTLLQIVLLGCAANSAAFGLIWFISQRLIKREQYNTQATVYVVGVYFISLVIAWLHRTSASSQLIFIIPLLLTMLFVNKQAQLLSFWLTILFYTLFLLGLYAFEPDSMPNVDEITVALGILMFAQAIIWVVLEHQLDLIAETAQANQQRMLDSLTKLYNHATFYEQLDHHIIRNAKEDQTFSMIIFDIDDFKLINDQYGHDVGDTVILCLVSAINNVIGPEDIAFRYGGEEFTILTPSSKDTAYELTERIRNGFVGAVAQSGECFQATVSAGICQFDRSRFNGRREFFASADEALYRAKRTGKNKAVVWTNDLLDRI